MVALSQMGWCLHDQQVLPKTQQVINKISSKCGQDHATSWSFLLRQSAVLSLVGLKQRKWKWGETRHVSHGMKGCFWLVQTFFIDYSWREEKTLKGSVSCTHHADNLLCTWICLGVDCLGPAKILTNPLSSRSCKSPPLLTRGGCGLSSLREETANGPASGLTLFALN